MPSNLPRPRSRRYQRRAARWAELAAYRSVRPATLEADVHGAEPIQERVGHILLGALRAGDLAVYAKVMAPIDAVIERLPPVDLAQLSSLIHRYVAADEGECIARGMALVEKTAEAYRGWRLALELQRGLSLEMHRALRALELLPQVAA
ncbi:MAG: hypothetical protein HOP28_12275 [Gemmatimonadales bacterium]|nr:hypothetical protein [Gemmatimonadales bacterium]